MNTHLTNNTTSSSHVNVVREVLPTRVVELPTAIHEQIRHEKITEVQPVVNVEKIKTEVVQKTQPVYDREIKAVNIEQKTLATQILPDVVLQNGGVAMARDVNTVDYLNTKSVTIEKPAIYNEVEKQNIIEEIQPVIYKETVVPSVLKETKPSYQKIVEGTTYVNQTLPSVQLPTKGTNYVPDQSTPRGINETVVLPTQRIELPTAIHEQIRHEKVEEIQPIINIEKIKTQVIQKTQPLMDREIKPVSIEERLLPTQMLPQVNLPSHGVAMNRDISTTNYLESKSVVIEKPAVFNELEKRQIIEEIQPVIYKETIVPEVIKETKPSYQKIIEGTTYTSEILPPMQLNSSHYKYPANYTTTATTTTFTENFVQPVQQSVPVVQPVMKPVAHHHQSIIEKKKHNMMEETTTTVTQTVEQIAPKPMK